MGVKQDFEVARHWIGRNDSSATRSFNPPASSTQIAEAERQLQLALPASTRSLYRLANGQPSAAVALEGSFLFMSLDEVVDAAAFLNEEFPEGTNVHDPDHAPMDVDEGIRPTWWSPNWVPIMSNGGGDYLCVDLDPAAGGTVGQVLTYYHDETFRRVVASGMDAFLSAQAARMASGRCRIEDGMIEDR